MPALGVGLAKLVVAGSLAIGGLTAGYNAVKPNTPMAADERRQQAVQQHSDYERTVREPTRRAQLRRGIDVDNARRLRSTPVGGSRVPGPLRWVLRRAPKPRLR